MSGLQITVTTAGRAAIVNAENTGTAPVRIAQIGITAQAFTPNAGMTALPGEMKRLTTFAGAAVADDTVHVTVRDDSADVYTMRGFALYLENGTLFALYGQAGAILEKSAQAMMLLAADIRFVQVDATSLTFGDTDWINPPATTTVQGVVELADAAEAVTGADATRAMTPATTKAVLDDRLGPSAPSAFVKTLLALATAAAIRAALALKSAALKDEGAGNGLDADLLDGQHGAYYRDWNNLTNRPATFPPSAHGHTWSQLSDPPATATRWPTWLEVTDKPATFPPSAHSHAAGDVTSGVFDPARIPDLPIGKITNLQNSLDQKAPVANPVFTGTAKSAGGLTSDGGSVSSNAPAGQNAHYWLRDETGVARALLFWDRSSGTLRMRRYNEAGNAAEGELALYATTCAWNGNTLWHAGNFDPSTKLNKAGDVASGPLTFRMDSGAALSIQNAAGTLKLDIGNNFAANGDGIAFVLNRANTDLVFGTNNTERGRIKADDGRIAWRSQVQGYGICAAGHFHPYSQNVAFSAFQARGAYGGGYVMVDGSVWTGIWTQSDGTISFGVGTSAGLTPYWVMSGNSAFDRFRVNGAIKSVGTSAALYFQDRSSAQEWAWYCTGGIARLWTGTGDAITITNGGALWAAGGFQYGSSIKLKTDLEPLPYGLDAIERIEVSRGRYKRELDDAPRLRLFVIAEQLADVVPEAVFADAVEHEGERVPSVDYMQLVPVLIRAVQELAAEVRSLKGCALAREVR